MKNTKKGIVRDATVSDVAAMYDLTLDLFAEAKGAYSLTSLAPKIGDKIIRAVKHNFAYVIEERGKIVGFATFALMRNATTATEYMCVDDLCIANEKRKRGYGTALLYRVLTYARGLGLSYVYLYVGRNNEQAIRFYTKFGFKMVGANESSFELRKLLA